VPYHFQSGLSRRREERLQLFPEAGEKFWDAGNGPSSKKDNKNILFFNCLYHRWAIYVIIFLIFLDKKLTFDILKFPPLIEGYE